MPPNPKNKAPSLPEQDLLHATCLRPGRQVDLIVDTDLVNNLIDIRSTTLQLVHASGRLLLAQPSRPFRPSHVGRPLEVTFLAKYADVPGGRWLRVGYKTRLQGIIPEYRVTRDRKEPLLVIPMPGKLVQCTLRLDFRLVPPMDHGLVLCLWPEGGELNIVDISMGGAKFTHPAEWWMEPGQRLILRLGHDEKKLILECQILRSEPLAKTGSESLNQTAVQWQELNTENRKTLSALLHDLMRYRLAQRSGMLETVKP